MATQSITTMDAAAIRRAQGLHIGHNPVADFLFGPVAAGVRVEAGAVRGAEGRLPVRIYRAPDGAATAAPIVVNFHGGGWVLGGLDANDWICSHVAATTGAVVVSVDYRLAPDAPWPAAPEDCYAAVVDIAHRAAEFGGGPDRLAVMGDSAGANLAAVVCLLTRDRSGPVIAHQTLMYPATDLTWSSPSVTENPSAPLLTTPELARFRDLYLGSQDPRHPAVSPLAAEDLGGLAPALIQVAGFDPLRDDGARYAEALEAAGTPARLTLFPEMPHGFMSFPGLFRQPATHALSELCQEQTRHLTSVAS